MKFDHAGGYFDDRYGGFGQSWSDLGSDPYGKRSEESPRYDRFAMMVCMRMKVAKWSRMGLGAPRRSLRRGRPRSTTMEVNRFRFRKGFDGDFEFEQDREGCPQGRNSTRREEWGPEVSGQVVAGESWSEHHGCSLPGTTMSFSE